MRLFSILIYEKLHFFNPPKISVFPNNSVPERGGGWGGAFSLSYPALTLVENILWYKLVSFMPPVYFYLPAFLVLLFLNLGLLRTL